MKTLQTALSILEYIVNGDGNPIPPGKIAEHFGMNATSCVRILQDFCGRGYLEQVSRKAGYIAGPAAFTFVSHINSKYARIVQASIAPLKILAHEVESLVNISVIYNDYRYILYYYCPEKIYTRFIPKKTRFCDDFYTTATGRLLLATLPEKEIRSIIKKFNIFDFYGTKIDIDKFIKELSIISRNDYIYWKHPVNQIQLSGALVKIKDFPIAAIGFGTSKDLNEIVKPALETAVQNIKKQFINKDIISKYTFN